MLKHHKFRPYIRRLHGNEEAHDLATQIQLSFYNNLLQNKEIPKAYVLTQRGFSKHVIAVSNSKQTLIQKALQLNNNAADFKDWSKQAQAFIINSQPEATNPLFIDLTRQ